TSPALPDASATTPSTASVQPTTTPVPPRPQYILQVILDYANKSVVVDETITYPNHTGHPLTDLVLAVEPELWQGCFALIGLGLNGSSVSSYALNGQKLSFALPNVLPPEATVSIHIQYSLTLPKLVQQHGVRPRIFGYSDIQMNLTDWYPFVVPNIGGQWVLHDPWYYGEHLVYDAADYVVHIKPADPAVNPVIASSGAPDTQAGQTGEGTTYTLTAGRTFAISASTDYQTSTVQVGDVAVTSYYFPLYKGAGEAAMNAAAQALQIYSQRYGPYSHKTLAVVMGDFNDGMEFSALFFMTRGAYNLFDGTFQNLTTTVSAHETAHQWWFEQVASDQALDPWMDEALAAYSEHVFYETAHPEAVDWWWSYWLPRVGGSQATSWVDSDIYSAGGFIPYTNGVYMRGARFLDALRQRIGDPSFFAFLQDYLFQENGKIAAPSDFFRILATHTTTDYSDIVRQYFQNVY
ncbi:MAG TPA: M1 family aminopeptidase, partial [Anaerolineales bacterium]